jgi:hypothetical protein
VTDRTEKEISRREGVKPWPVRELPKSLEALNNLAHQAATAQIYLYQDGKAKKAIEIYKKMDPSALKPFLAKSKDSTEYVEANRLWDEILYDLDAVDSLLLSKTAKMMIMRKLMRNTTKF